MKRIFLALSLAVCALTMSAKTIHWLTFIDTTDPNVGKIDINTRKILYNRWINVINAALKDKGYTPAVYDYYSVQTTPENCKSAIENLLVDSEDIIVFYYIGHGGRSVSDEGKYPQMWMAQEDQSRMIPLYWVHEQLQNKGARFALTIGMCCNSFTEGVTPKEAPTFGRNTGNTYMNNTQIRNIQKLFLEQKGSIVVSSSKPGEPSIGVPYSDLGPTDFFSYVLVKLFNEMVNTGNGLTWQSYLDNICEGVKYVSNGQQNPQYDIYPPIEREHENGAEEEKIDNEAPNVDMTTEDLIQKYLEIIVDKNIQLSERISAATQMKKLFAPGAKVKILNQDGDIVVNTKNAIDYIDIISTNRILLKVVYVDFDFNENDQILLLKVQEFYRRN